MFELSYQLLQQSIEVDLQSIEETIAAGHWAIGSVPTRDDLLRSLVLDYDALFMPFRIRLNGQNLFTPEVIRIATGDSLTSSNQGWLTCTIVRAAADGLSAVFQSIETGYSATTLVTGASPGIRIGFRSIGEQTELLLLTAHGNWWEGDLVTRHSVHSDELLTEWTRFAERVRVDLLEAIPALVGHEAYGPWFRDGESGIPSLRFDDCVSGE
jgi:hypothetical protein